MTTAHDISTDLARLREYIQGYVDKPGNTESWSGLFARAAVSQGTMNKIRKSDFKERPTPKTLEKIADAMGVEMAEIMTVAGYFQGADQTILRTRNEYDLTSAEARLIDAFRKLSSDYQAVSLRMVVDMSEAGGMQ